MTSDGVSSVRVERFRFNIAVTGQEVADEVGQGVFFLTWVQGQG